MAKQVVGPFEKHVEKAVVGLAGIALIAVTALYVVTSPNQIEIGDRTVTPGTVEQLLADKAADVRRAILAADASETTVEPLAGHFNTDLEPFAGDALATGLVAGPMPGPPVPIIDPPGERAGRARLVKVLQLEKPAIKQGRSTFTLPDASYTATNWVTVFAAFDRETQRDLQAKAYGIQRQKVIFGPVEIQRRARRDNGAWSDDDWELVSAWPSTGAPAPPSIALIQEDGMVLVPREDLTRVDQFQQALNDPIMQISLLRPLMYDIYNGDAWAFPDGVNYVEVLRMDDDYFHWNEVARTPDDDLQDRYMLDAARAAIEPATEVTRAKADEIEVRLKQADALLAQAKSTRVRSFALDAYNEYVEIKYDKNASASQRAEAARKAKDADQVEKDIRRELRDRTGAGEGEALDGPMVQERELWPKQQVWAHDALPGNVKSGTTYQYRIRVNLFNRLVAEPGKFANPDDAKTVFIPGEWSEPSDPVVVEPVYRWFVTGCDPRERKVKVELYRWFDGVWVTTRKEFGVGERIFTRSREPVPDWDYAGSVDRPEIDFDPGAVVLDVDFHRLVRERKERAGTVSFADRPSEECSALVVHATGKLEERFATMDKDDPVKKAMKDRVYKPPK